MFPSQWREEHTSNLHAHVSGSVSDNFLEATAAKNGKTTAWQALKSNRTECEALQEKADNAEINAQLSALLFQQFIYINQIIQTPEDVKDATIDAIKTDDAKNSEWRSTPKDDWSEYVDAFVAGLAASNEKNKGNKYAVGILSLDRTKHNFDHAKQFIDRVVEEKAKTGLLVGIDISGNYNTKNRSLTGDTLEETLNYALSKNIGIAIHVGEIDNKLERDDVDLILKTLIAWYENNKNAPQYQRKNPFHGKIRFGHAIYLTDSQRELIQKYQIPIEVCPSCHHCLRWAKINNQHPVTNIYNSVSDPLVIGTDDYTLFHKNEKVKGKHKELPHGLTKHQFDLFCSFFSNPNQLSRKEVKIHHSSFSFAR